MNILARLLVVALAGAAVGARAAEPDVVRLGNLKFAHYGAVSYMKEIAPKYNLKVEERVFAKGLDIIPGILAGEIDVGASALDAAVAGRAGGSPVFVVAGFAKGGARIVARPDLNIKSVAELKGRRVGVARGGAQELLLFAELAKHKLSWSDQPGKDVQIVYMAFADLNQALQQKQIDAMCQSEPQSSQAINKGWGGRDHQAVRHRAGRAGARAGDDRKDVQRAARRGRAFHEAVRRSDPDVRREPAARRKVRA